MCLLAPLDFCCTSAAHPGACPTAATVHQYIPSASGRQVGRQVGRQTGSPRTRCVRGFGGRAATAWKGDNRKPAQCKAGQVRYGCGRAAFVDVDGFAVAGGWTWCGGRPWK